MAAREPAVYYNRGDVYYNLSGQGTSPTTADTNAALLDDGGHSSNGSGEIHTEGAYEHVEPK